MKQIITEEMVTDLNAFLHREGYPFEFERVEIIGLDNSFAMVAKLLNVKGIGNINFELSNEFLEKIKKRFKHKYDITLSGHTNSLY